MKLIRLITALTVGFSMLLSGCGNNEKKFKIGVSQCSDDEWRSQMNDEMRREIMFHDDAEIEIRTANDNNAEQIADLKYFTDNDFDLIIVSPREAESITPAVKRAFDKGIPVIVFDRNINGPYYTSYMELDNEGIGRSAAQYARHAIGDKTGNILELRGLDGSTPSIERHKGFNSVIDNEGRLKIVSSVSANWKGDDAYKAADTLLRQHPEVNVIYAHNDVMALGAAKAAKNLGREDIIILGTDAAPALGIQAVADSMIDATFVYPTEGERIIRNAIDILNGKPYRKIDHVPARYAVDSTNAEILLRQNELLNDKTRQIELLNGRNEQITSVNTVQKKFLLAMVIAAFLLVIIAIAMLYFLRQRKKYTKLLSQKNKQLQDDKDQLDTLYIRLQEATNSKLVFFTNVSHDLRTPVSLISEPVRQLAEADYLKPEHATMANVALKNVNILQRLIEQILDFRKLQNGRTELNLQEADIMKLVEEWASSFKTIASRRLINFTVVTDGECRMGLDEHKLERVFFNILSNAFKFTPDGGEINVECLQEDSEAIIKVKDTGIGMTTEEASHVFERFYQVDKVRPKGSGIGLSLSKAFIEMMGGSISVESTPGKGSTFIIRIPIQHVENKLEKSENYNEDFRKEIITELEPVEREIVEHDPDRQLILAIDDNPDVTTLLKEILSDKYNVITANEGKTGIRMARKYVPDLIISDIMMPGIDGLEVCRIIKNEIETSHIPVLMLTACSLDEQRMQSYDSGADSFISKPFTSEMILSRCANLILNRKKVHDLYADPLKAIKEKKTTTVLPASDDRNALESDFYNSFLAIVTNRFAESDLSVADIASHLGIGATQLSRKIKALTNFSPVDIIRNIRLRNARRQLLTSEKSISEIAYDNGFSSPQYFSKCFRDLYGETPTEMRNKK